MHPIGADPIVVVGTGPVGIRVVEELTKHGCSCPCVVYGAEPHEPYDRVRLSSLLSGRDDLSDLQIDSVSSNSKVSVRLNCRVSRIHPDERAVVDEDGNVQPYQVLVLATGSTPHVPVTLSGVSLPGVFTFRNLGDVEGLIARRTRSVHTVVLGGGQLGLEAARAMRRDGTRVTVIEHNSHVMYRQLDRLAARMVQRSLVSDGIDILTNRNLVMAIGAERLEAVTLADGETLSCDTLIIATGIRPEIKLAQDAKLACGYGIRVDARMQTSNPNIYAVGECCEYDGQVYGLVGPGLAQAQIVARVLMGQTTSYRKPALASSLKVVDLPVFSLGEINTLPSTHTSWTWENGECYRRLVVNRGHVEAAVSIGQWDDVTQLRDKVSLKRRLRPWELWRFHYTGQLWANVSDVSVWPDDAQICSCNSVSRGEISRVITSGAKSVDDVIAKTRAGSTCGSCTALIRQLVEPESAPPISELSVSLRLVAMFAGAMALAGLVVSVPYASTVNPQFALDMLWTDINHKRLSGFVLLGVVLLTLPLALRKRTSIQWGAFNVWRLLHATIGVLCLGALLVHTGFRMGSQLNFLLMLTFLGLIFAGAVVGVLQSFEHRLNGSGQLSLRKMGATLHIFLLWPLPALLIFHILKSYYF
ncbi:MAG: FAD-dependent oxidoreductase [Pseudomonadota bacterium]